MTDVRDTTAPHAPLTGGYAERLAELGRALDLLETGDRGDDAVQHRELWTKALSGTLPPDGVGADAALDELTSLVVPHGPRMTDSRFWGWITVAPTTVPVVALTAAAVASPQRYLTTAFNLLEEQSLDWLADLCGLDPRMKGVYSSGGSTANLVALGAARQWAWEQRGVDAGQAGVDGRRTTIYATSETHHTVARSAGVLGIGRGNVRHVGTDEQLRMRPDLLAQAIDDDVAAGFLPVAVVATAGTTNTGSIDPVRALGDVARDRGVWFHVDGAYGLPGVLDERIAPLYDGLELADSAIVDPHKWLGAPVGVAATYVRDRSILLRAFTQEPADYLESVGAGHAAVVESSLDDMGEAYADWAVELSAPARGVVVWSTLRELGRSGVAARVRADDDHARHLADLARAHPRLEVLIEPVLSVCCVRYVPSDDAGVDVDALNERLLRRLHRDTPFQPSSTRVHGTYAVRACFINARTTAAHVEAFVDELVSLGDALARG